MAPDARDIYGGKLNFTLGDTTLKTHYAVNKDDKDSIRFLSNAKGIIINFEIHPSISLHLINNVMQTIENTINPNCKVILNTISSTFIEDMKMVSVRVILVGL